LSSTAHGPRFFDCDSVLLLPFFFLDHPVDCGLLRRKNRNTSAAYT
jgi:hypothetical protein